MMRDEAGGSVSVFVFLFQSFVTGSTSLGKEAYYIIT